METARMLRTWQILALLLLLVLPVSLPAASISNLEREKNWADQIVDYLVTGEAVRLEANQVKFLALYTKPTAAHNNSTQGVILLHGRGVHPAWGFIDTLRADLADAGWHTLSLQLPILDADIKLSEYGKTFPEAFQRIDAGVRYLRARGVKQIVLIGHSSGAMTAAAYAAEYPKAALAGIVTIGFTTELTGRYMQATSLLEKIRLPVLDIFGGQDLAVVLNTAKARAGAAKKAGNNTYTQARIKGANHFFPDHYNDLRANLGAWLAKLPAK
jgi:pimeloyl-ACP methyl ester carboxylesterase